MEGEQEINWDATFMDEPAILDKHKADLFSSDNQNSFTSISNRYHIYRKHAIRRYMTPEVLKIEYLQLLGSFILLIDSLEGVQWSIDLNMNENAPEKRNLFHADSAMV